ncbi:MAG: hypothetical protein LBM75_01975, partial [Myxococcales bacterium]|nr:hypothetical protein [Myxococcales bacterium]
MIGPAIRSAAMAFRTSPASVGSVGAAKWVGFDGLWASRSVVVESATRASTFTAYLKTLCLNDDARALRCLKATFGHVAKMTLI